MQTRERIYDKKLFEILETIADFSKSGSRKKMFTRVFSDREKVDLRIFYYDRAAVSWKASKSGITFDLVELKSAVLPVLLKYVAKTDPIWYADFIKSLNVTEPSPYKPIDGDIHIDL